MSSRREVFVRTLVLHQRKTLIETKNSHIKKMLKTALFDCAINEKCCSVDGGRGIFFFFFFNYLNLELDARVVSSYPFDE